MTKECPSCGGLAKIQDDETDVWSPCTRCWRGEIRVCLCCELELPGFEMCDTCVIYQTPTGLRCDRHDQFFPRQREP